MNEDTVDTDYDPNNLVFLSIHRGQTLIDNLYQAKRDINEIIDEEIEVVRTAIADLSLELPEGYSAPWHQSGSLLINNCSGYYQDP